MRDDEPRPVWEVGFPLPNLLQGGRLLRMTFKSFSSKTASTQKYGVRGLSQSSRVKNHQGRWASAA